MLSSSFFAAFPAGDALKAACFACHAAKVFCHVFRVSWNQAEGWILSILAVRFLSNTHLLKYSLLFAAFCHSKRTSSKPSDFSGIEKLAKPSPSALAVKSLTVDGRNHL